MLALISMIAVILLMLFGIWLFILLFPFSIIALAILSLGWLIISPVIHFFFSSRSDKSSLP
jgi:uncharacterized membrane protein